MPLPTLTRTGFRLWTLKEAVNHLEDAIITISGPALAISGIIAGLDLITGGSVLKDSPNLGMTWAICLLVTLDFQVLAFGVRAHRIYRRQAPGARDIARKAGELLLCIVIAASISYVSIQMQSVIARTTADKTTTVAQAEIALGVNGNALIWERSSLVLVLIFLSGWSRGSEETREPARQEETPIAPATPAQVPAPIVQPAIDIDALLRALDERTDHKLEFVVREMRATLQQVTASMPAIAAPTSANEQLALSAGQPAQALNSQVEDLLPPALDSNGEHPVDNLEPIVHRGTQDNQDQAAQPIYPKQFESKEQAIIEACRLNPGARPEQIALIVACSVKTAQRWMDRHQIAYPDTDEEDKLAIAIRALHDNPTITDEDLAGVLQVKRPASARFWRLKAGEATRGLSHDTLSGAPSAGDG
ncbi:MAG: hypothetical protein M3Y81_18065 [Chloroflexota bacterium]|nr:hypothetical protein [Chloroflexota bacterium]